MKICRTLALSLAALLVIAQAASAQDWQQKRRDRPQQPQQQQQVPQPQFAPGGGGGACSPSGFARLSRNCSVNTGGCQHMPQQCNRGWCCP